MSELNVIRDASSSHAFQNLHTLLKYRLLSTKRQCKIKQGFGSLTGSTSSHTSDLSPTEPEHTKGRPSGDQTLPSLATTTPPASIFFGLCTYTQASFHLRLVCGASLSSLPPSVSSLTCLLRKPVLTCLPTNKVQGDKGIKGSECLPLQSQLTLCDMFSQKTEGLPLERIQKSDLSSQAAAACLDLRPTARWIPGFCFQELFASQS